MNRTNLIMGILLGASLLVNVAILARPSGEKGGAQAPNRPRPFVAEPQPVAVTTSGLSNDAKMDRVLSELDRLRREVSAIRTTAGKTSANPTEAGPTLLGSTSPRLAELLGQGNRNQQFWKDLETLSEARDSMSEEEYRQFLLSASADFLELAEPARSQFVEAARAAATELERARREHTEALKALPKAEMNPKGFEESWAKLAEAEKRAKAQVKPFLSSDQPRHKHFRKNLDQWFSHLAGSDKVLFSGGAVKVFKAHVGGGDEDE